MIAERQAAAASSRLRLRRSSYRSVAPADQRGLEVDIVLSGERGLKVIAAKRASRVRDDDLVPLRTLQQDYPMAQAWRVYAPGEPWLAGP